MTGEQIIEKIQIKLRGVGDRQTQKEKETSKMN